MHVVGWVGGGAPLPPVATAPGGGRAPVLGGAAAWPGPLCLCERDIASHLIPLHTDGMTRRIRLIRTFFSCAQGISVQRMKLPRAFRWAPS